MSFNEKRPPPYQHRFGEAFEEGGPFQPYLQQLPCIL